MRLAAAAYPLSPLRDWAEYEAKLTAWLQEAAEAGADLALFPEYGAMELAMLAGPETASDLEGALRAVAGLAARADALHARLAARLGLHVCAASAPVFDPGASGSARPVNRARLFAPGGAVGVQDKQVMTRFEREEWGVVPGGPLRLFETELGRIGILICYDAEFPRLSEALIGAGAEILLVPSCTDTVAGFCRVQVGARARALEGQCVVLHAPTILPAPFCPAVDLNHGAAGLYGPPDLGFPETGILALGEMDRPGWVMADVSRAAIARVRAEGAVLNHAHGPESHARAARVEPVTLY